MIDKIILFNNYLFVILAYIYIFFNIIINILGFFSVVRFCQLMARIKWGRFPNSGLDWLKKHSLMLTILG